MRIILDTREDVQASAPVVISENRATEIPTFYADWFFKRLEQGYSAWINPFIGVKKLCKLSL